jgi:multidrug efflux pump subunit AcrA (membrane-fusion protein)
VEVGDRVKAGAVLAEMDATNARISLQNAKAMERLAAARLAEAEREAARAKQVYEGQAMSQSGFDQAQTGREIAAAQLDQARAALAAAEQAVQDCTITAPFAGVVTACTGARGTP